MHGRGVQVFEQILKGVPIQKRLTTTGLNPLLQSDVVTTSQMAIAPAPVSSEISDVTPCAHAQNTPHIKYTEKIRAQGLGKSGYGMD